MKKLTRRPISIWIAQILLLLAGIPFSIVLFFSLIGDAAFLAANQLTFFSVVGTFVFLIVKIAFVLLFFFAFWGLAKRKNYGRWLAVVAILMIVALSVLGKIIGTSGPIETYEYTNNAQQIGGIIGAVTIYGLFGLLLYKLALGANVKEFFQPAVSIEIAEPPPPPHFANM